jgi:hypothetical protein
MALLARCFHASSSTKAISGVNNESVDHAMTCIMTRHHDKVLFFVNKLNQHFCRRFIDIFMQMLYHTNCIVVKAIKMSELILNYIWDPMALYIQAVGYCSREVFVYANDECGCIV